MYQYYNAHPKGLLVRDCVKRAISKAAEMDYHQVQLELNKYKKITGAKAFNSDRNPDKYVVNVLKAVKLSFPAKRGVPRMNGERFCKAYPEGSYILQMAGHWSCCVDGVIYDTWDCSDKCVYTAWKLPKQTVEIRSSINTQQHSDVHRIEGKNKDQVIKELKKDFERFLQNIDAYAPGTKFVAEIL